MVWLLRSRARRRGFSLLEMGVALIVLAVVAAIAIPAYNAWLNRAYDRAAEEVLRNVSSRAQSAVAAAELAEFTRALIDDTVSKTPADLAALGSGLSAAVSFATTSGPSEAYGQISVGIDTGGDRHGLAMVSRSGNCVMSSAGLRDAVSTSVHGPLGDGCRGSAAGGTPEFEPPGPPEPADLCATSAGGCDEGDRRVILRWEPSSSSDVDRYELYRDEGACPPSGPGQLLGSVDADVTTFTDEDGLVNGQPYCYWIIAIDRAGNPSDPDRETLTPVDNVAPPAPTNLVATGEELSVRLNWDAVTAPDLAGYRILRSTEHPDESAVNSDGDPGPERSTYVLIATTIGPDTTFLDTLSGVGGTVWTTRFWYKVEAYDSSSNVSAPSNPASAVPSNGTHPGAVTLTATAGIQRAWLSWTEAENQANLGGYRIWRDGTLIATVSATTTTFTDVGLADGTSYTYEVASFSLSDVESPKSSATATTVAVPAGLATTPGANQIGLSWSSVAGAERYHIDVDGSGTPLIDTTGTTGTHTGLGNSESHDYRVRACADYGSLVCTGWSTPVPGITLPGAAVLTATSGVANQIPLSWVSPSGVGQASWQLQWRTISGSWSNIATGIPAGTRTWSHTEAAGVVDGVSYVFRVRAQGPTGLWGPWSNEVTAASMALPNRPSFISFAGPNTMQCPRGWFATHMPAWMGLPAAYPTNSCFTIVVDNGGPGPITISGFISTPGRAVSFTGAGAWNATAVNIAKGASWLDVAWAYAQACNPAGCVDAAVSALSIPQPTFPALTKTGCAWWHCEIRATSFWASSMEVATVGGLYGSGFAFTCTNCSMYKAGVFSGVTSWPRSHNGWWTFHIVPRTFDEPCDAVGCNLRVAFPLGTNIAISGSSWSSLLAPDGWCKPRDVDPWVPIPETCRYSSITA